MALGGDDDLPGVTYTKQRILDLTAPFFSVVCCFLC